MLRCLVTFKYEGQLESAAADIHDDEPVMHEIIALLRAGGVAMIGWESVHDNEFDHHEDKPEPVLQDHTLFEVRLEIHNPDHPEEAIDWHDGGDDLFHYVMDALELGNPEITYFYTHGEPPMQKSVIGIDIHPAY